MSKNLKLVNTDASHLFNGGSDQGMVVGCGSCGNKGVVQARGIVGQSGGGGYGFQKPTNPSKNTFSPTTYSGCHVQSPMKLGAGMNQKGGMKHLLSPSTVDMYNQTTNPGYGYVSGKYNKLFSGSGYPKMTPTTKANTCKNGGSKKKRSKSKTRKMRKKKSHMKRHKKKHDKKNASKKKRSKSKTRKMRKKMRKKKSHMKRHKKKHARKHKRKTRGGKKTHQKNKRKTQRGGYSQYQSDVPLTYTMQTPNGPQGGSWIGQLATPPTYKALNNCQDNYNHYKQK